MPAGTTHVDRDGDYWKCDNGQWYFYRDGFGWCAYVGLKNQSFFAKLREI